MLDEPDIPQAESLHEQLLDNVVLCAHCMAHNRPIDEFCHDCGMPIGQYVWNQPLQGVLAQGWAYRRASTGRVSPILFWGMWAMFGPVVMVFMISVGEMIMSGELMQSESYSLAKMFGVLLTGCVTLLYVMLLIRVTRNYRRYRN